MGSETKTLRIPKSVQGGADPIGDQPETGGHQAPPGVGLIALVSEGLRGLVRSRMQRADTQASADTADSPQDRGRGAGASRAAMVSGITGGMSLLLDGSRHRGRR
jgi:hypothetical protein